MVEVSKSRHITFEYFLGNDFNDDTKKLSKSTDFTAASEASLSGELTDDVTYSVEGMTQIMVRTLLLIYNDIVTIQNVLYLMLIGSIWELGIGICVCKMHQITWKYTVIYLPF